MLRAAVDYLVVTQPFRSNDTPIQISGKRRANLAAKGKTQVSHVRNGRGPETGL